MKLKKIRLEKGLSIPQLVELSGVPCKMSQNIEKCNDDRVSTMSKLANALGVTLDELCR